MKRIFILLLLMLALGSVLGRADVQLNLGDSITLGGQLVSCGGSPSPPANPPQVSLINQSCACNPNGSFMELDMVYTYSDGTTTTTKLDDENGSFVCQQNMASDPRCNR